MDQFYDDRRSPGRSGMNPRLAQSFPPSNSFAPSSVRQYINYDQMLGGE